MNSSSKVSIGNATEYPDLVKSFNPESPATRGALGATGLAGGSGLNDRRIAAHGAKKSSPCSPKGIENPVKNA
jgi:hypothetical protein